jgi:serine/threonine-protein kinase
VRDLLRRCLTKDRRERLQSIGDARIEIRDYLAAPPLAGGSENIRPKPDADGRRREHAYLALAAVLALALIAVAAGWWHAAQPLSHPVVRLDVDLGPNYYGDLLSLSPDGTHIVYWGRGADGKDRLYGRALDRDQAVPLPGTENGQAPFFSPDGQYIGFFADGKLKKISVEGGGVTVLCAAPDSRGGSWSEDGSIIAALDVNAGLSRVSSDGGVVQSVTVLMKEKNEVTHRWPQVLPGAQAVIFTASSATGGYEEATIQAQSLGRVRDARWCRAATSVGSHRAGTCCTCDRECCMRRLWTYSGWR